MSRADELRAQLAAAEASEAFVAAKTAFQAGELDRKAYKKAVRQLTAARVKQRVGEGRPGSEHFRIDDKGRVVALKTRVHAVKTRDENGRIIPEKTVLEERTTEEVLG